MDWRSAVIETLYPRSTMGVLDSIRRLFGRAENAMNEADYAALDAVHRAEDRIDEATGGRYYDTVEKADDEAGELLERLHLDSDPGADDASVATDHRDA
jgi:hypothetical protein